LSQSNKPIQRILEPNNPAAGAEFSLTVDGRGGLLIRSLRFLFTADANVATRAVLLTVTNGSREWYRSRASGSVTAGLAVTHGAYEGASGGAAGTTHNPFDFPANGLWVPRGHTLATVTNNIQVGDQISGIGIYAIEFPSGPEWDLWPTYPYMAMWPPYPTQE